MSKNPIHNRQDKKRYYSLNDYLREHYGEKLYKIALNANMTCPNRDGTLGRQGCIFCSAGGSGDFASDSRLTITEQIETGKATVSSKHTGGGYIAYFQAYTNTYAPLPYLQMCIRDRGSYPHRPSYVALNLLMWLRFPCSFFPESVASFSDSYT